MSLASIRSGELAVLLGGTSAERDISLRSGATIAAGLRAAGFTVREVDTAAPDWPTQLAGVQFAFIALHGRGGEDGTVQGALHCLGIPYSGSGVLGSALALDKLRSKQIWQALGLPTAGFEVLSEHSDWEALAARLGRVFVKPAGEGSSIGMRDASDASSLRAAWAYAAQSGQAVIAERFIDGPEYTVGLLGTEVLPAIRVEVAEGFYDYRAKYHSNATRYHIPCGLAPAAERELGALCQRAFQALGCAVWGRVDVMHDPEHGFQLLEVNTIPGMTDHSLVPMAARAHGLGIEELLCRVIELSLDERGAS